MPLLCLIRTKAEQVTEIGQASARRQEYVAGLTEADKDARGGRTDYLTRTLTTRERADVHPSTSGRDAR